MISGDDLRSRSSAWWYRFERAPSGGARSSATISTPSVRSRVRPVAGAGSHLDERTEAGERRQHPVVGEDVRVALSEIGKPVGSDAGEQLLEPVAIHDPHRLVEIDAKYAPPLPPPISTDAGAEPT